jgi:hypothetical protein
MEPTTIPPAGPFTPCDVCLDASACARRRACALEREAGYYDDGEKVRPLRGAAPSEPAD